ncbi:SDR family oxidoreductase [uncultured Roseobacter sp.]|uniref:SDR family oxidoreductase n=1 Tax=uncultured Roseobacter sp. TaxID=114847 RepID=UPI0026321143|nr:SDR family oxidoreductase [uncultured Roseobacter sp.]
MTSAIVLGGSAGIGHAVVLKLLDRGHVVGVVARGKKRLEKMSAEFGDRVACQSADVADPQALRQAVGNLIRDLGAPAIWVNCAMATSFSPFSKVGPPEFQRIMDVTFMGQVNGTRLAIEHMASGRIICVGSGLSYRSVPNQAAYCAAKHAINGFSSSVRSELKRDDRDLDISLVQLPAVNTPQFDWALNRMAKKPQPAPPIFAPSVAAEGVMKAIDTGAREVFVGRSVLQLVFAQFILPAWMDKKMADSGVDAQKSDEPASRPDPVNLYDPVDYPARPEGSYSDDATDTGWIVDADYARLAVFGGGAILLFVLGLLIG